MTGVSRVRRIAARAGLTVLVLAVPATLAVASRNGGDRFYACHRNGRKRATVVVVPLREPDLRGGIRRPRR